MSSYKCFQATIIATYLFKSIVFLEFYFKKLNTEVDVRWIHDFTRIEELKLRKKSCV